MMLPSGTELALLQQMFHGPSLVGASSPVACPLLGRHPPRAELGDSRGSLGQGRPWQRPGLASRPPPAEGLGLGRTGAAARGCSGAGPRAGRYRPGRARYRKSSPRSGREPVPRRAGLARLPFPWPRRAGGAGHCPAPAAGRCCGSDPLLVGSVGGGAWLCPGATAPLGVFPGCSWRAAPCGQSAPRVIVPALRRALRVRPAASILCCLWGSGASAGIWLEVEEDRASNEAGKGRTCEFLLFSSCCWSCFM